MQKEKVQKQLPTKGIRGLLALVYKYPMASFLTVSVVVYSLSMPLFAEMGALKGEYRAKDRASGNTRFDL